MQYGRIVQPPFDSQDIILLIVESANMKPVKHLTVTLEGYSLIEGGLDWYCWLCAVKFPNGSPQD